MVTEPVPRAEADRLRIGWLMAPGDEAALPIRAELSEAAARLGGHIEIVPMLAGSPGYHELDALVVDAQGSRSADQSPALVVVLAADIDAGEHLGSLGRDAVLVMPRRAHGRFLLATILALLRWRSRE